MASLLAVQCPVPSIPLGARFLAALNELLFARNFCVDLGVPPRADSERAHVVASRVLWQGGVAHKTFRHRFNDTLLRNRIVVLETIIACLGEPAHRPPKPENDDSEWLFLQAYISGEAPYTATVFASLMSVAFGPKRSQDGYIRGASPLEECYVRTVTDVLTVAMSARAGRRNVYDVVMTSLKNADEFGFIVSGLLLRLTELDKASKEYFADGSGANATHATLMVTWKLLSCNEEFFNFFVRHESALSVFRLILRFAARTSAQVDASESGDFQKQLVLDRLSLVEVILLLLSSSREFSVLLNEPLVASMVDLGYPPGVTTYADALLFTVWRLVVDSARSSRGIVVDMLLTALSNVSPYIKSFSAVSSDKLINLVARFSKPRWLCAAHYNYQQLISTLEIINNLVQYQFEGNAELVYAIVRNHELFQLLDDLCYEKCIDGTGGAVGDEWSPTAGWFEDWKAKLKLKIVLRVIAYLLPILEREIQTHDLDQKACVQIVKRMTLVGILPVPHAIVIRSYKGNTWTSYWLMNSSWTLVSFVHPDLFHASGS